MKKLNRRGYLTVEIILASTITFVIAFFLFEITAKLIDTTDNAYVDTVLMTDKALTIKNIKASIQSDINSNGVIKEINCSNLACNITYNNDSTRKIVIDEKTIKYCDNDNCSYTNKLDESLSSFQITSSSSGNISDGDFFNIKVTAQNIFEDDSSYIINIPIHNIRRNVDVNISYNVTINSNVGYSNILESIDGRVTFSVTGTKSRPTFASISCDGGAKTSHGIPIIDMATSIQTISLTVYDITKNTTCTVNFKANSVVTPDPGGGDSNCRIENGKVICDA